MVEKFEEHGTVSDDPGKSKGRKAEVMTEENKQRVRDLFLERPETSTRIAAQQLSVESTISETSVHRILRSLDMFLYKIQIKQKLNLDNIENQLQFANTVIDMVDNEQIDVNKIWFSDECHFWLEGYVNKQNWRHWGTENPHLVVAKPLHPQRITVWCAISGGDIIGPIFIETNVNASVYLEEIVEPFLAQIENTDKLDDHWFMQDEAPAHRTQ